MFGKTCFSVAIWTSLLAMGSFCQTVDANADVWKVGAVLCLTGDCASDGNNVLRGAQLAIEELNATGGVLGKKVEIVLQDTNEAVNGAQAVTAYRQLRLDRSIHYFLGPSWVPGGLALAPIVAAESDVVMISPSLGAAEFHKAGPNLFNGRGVDELPSRLEARYAIAKGYRRAAIFSSQQPWEMAQANFFEDEFRKLGGEVVIREEPTPTVFDVGSEVLKIVKKKPDMVFISTIVLMARVARQLRQLRFPGFKMAANIDEQRIAEAQGALEGAVFFSFQKPTDEFRQKFIKRFGESPQVTTATGYDAMNAVAMAVKAANSFEPNVVIPALHSIKVAGASGTFVFDEEGCATKQPTAWKVVGAAYEVIPTEHETE